MDAKRSSISAPVTRRRDLVACAAAGRRAAGDRRVRSLGSVSRRQPAALLRDNSPGTVGKRRVRQRRDTVRPHRTVGALSPPFEGAERVRTSNTVDRRASLYVVCQPALRLVARRSDRPRDRRGAAGRAQHERVNRKRIRPTVRRQLCAGRGSHCDRCRDPGVRKTLIEGSSSPRRRGSLRTSQRGRRTRNN